MSIEMLEDGELHLRGEGVPRQSRHGCGLLEVEEKWKTCWAMLLELKMKLEFMY